MVLPRACRRTVKGSRRQPSRARRLERKARNGMAEIDERVTARSRALAQELAQLSSDIYIREAVIKLALDELARGFLAASNVRPFEVADHLRALADALEAV